MLLTTNNNVFVCQIEVNFVQCFFFLWESFCSKKSYFKAWKRFKKIIKMLFCFVLCFFLFSFFFCDFVFFVFNPRFAGRKQTMSLNSMFTLLKETKYGEHRKSNKHGIISCCCWQIQRKRIWKFQTNKKQKIVQNQKRLSFLSLFIKI